MLRKCLALEETFSNSSRELTLSIAATNASRVRMIPTD